MYQPLAPLCLFLSHPHPPPLDSAGTARSVSETRVPVLLTQPSSHICLAVVPNRWDQEAPLPQVSAQMP